MKDDVTTPGPSKADQSGARADEALDLACLTAALVLGREETAAALIDRLRGDCEDTDRGATSKAEPRMTREAVREAILQTYLFDGYPTALEGLSLLARHWPGRPEPIESGDHAEWNEWRARGESLYERIYGDVGVRLQERARELSPELARWMVVEGYGKVLARPGLDLATRELAIIAVLAVKRRPRQLHSHLRGALRIGVARERIERLFSALERELTPPGLDEARALLARLAA